MKITMYELLGLVKDGKAPKKFKYDSYVWTYNYESSAYWDGKGIEFEEYMDDGLMKYLTDEVEILEEEKKIPEKLKMLRHSCNFDRHEETLYENQVDLANKITEILDYLKSKGE